MLGGNMSEVDFEKWGVLRADWEAWEAVDEAGEGWDVGGEVVGLDAGRVEGVELISGAVL